MTEYKYLVAEVDVGLSSSDLESQLNTYGAQGWALIEAFPRGNVPGAQHIGIFIQEVPPPPEPEPVEPEEPPVDPEVPPEEPPPETASAPAPTPLPTLPPQPTQT